MMDDHVAPETSVLEGAVGLSIRFFFHVEVSRFPSTHNQLKRSPIFALWMVDARSIRKMEIEKAELATFSKVVW
jgi:hypothetical protein